MRRLARGPWQPVPFAWLPTTYEGVTYWLERAPYEMKLVGFHLYHDRFEFRRVGSELVAWTQWV